MVWKPQHSDWELLSHSWVPSAACKQAIAQQKRQERDLKPAHEFTIMPV